MHKHHCRQTDWPARTASVYVQTGCVKLLSLSLSRQLVMIAAPLPPKLTCPREDYSPTKRGMGRSSRGIKNWVDRLKKKKVASFLFGCEDVGGAKRETEGNKAMKEGSTENRKERKKKKAAKSRRRAPPLHTHIHTQNGRIELVRRVQGEIHQDLRNRTDHHALRLVALRDLPRVGVDKQQAERRGPLVAFALCLIARAQRTPVYICLGLYIVQRR